MPSTVGYMVTTGGLSCLLFMLIWLVLRAGGDESPWVPAGLAAGLIVLVAAAAREVVMRRAWARYTREMEAEMGGALIERPRLIAQPRTTAPQAASGAGSGGSGWRASIAALRSLQQRLSELDSPATSPEQHLEAYKLCEQYLAGADEVMRTSGGSGEMRVALRSGQERLRVAQKKHLLAWARGEATRLTQEAQLRVRLSDRIETAQRALSVLEEALKLYPEEPELRDSSIAVRDFIASVKIGQWVEMAERAAFRGRYARAIARYRDALFYLSRADMGDDARNEAAARIQREIELLRARLATADFDGEAPGPSSASRRHGAEIGSDPDL
jgi:hypothetical protein